MIRERLKRILAPYRYPQPVPELGVDRLYLYLDTLWRARALPGAIVEVGCFQCGTSAWAQRFLDAIGSPRPYVCIDTFAGFVDEQFAGDVRLGTRPSHRGGFKASSPALVRQLLEQWNCPSIQLMQADIVALPADRLPEHISVALIDVDLDEPTFAALDKIYPRLVPGGAILVDDCSDAPSNPFRGARVGYERFVRQRDLPERFALGMGCVDARVG
jgi:O-methyltransferase